MPTGAVLLDTTQYVRINRGHNPLLLQASRDTVKIAFSDVKPSLGNTAFHQLNDKNPSPYPIPIVDTNVWALATTDKTGLVVTEFYGSDGTDDNPIDTIAELGVAVLQQLQIMTSNQESMRKQLALLNMRAEEAWNTGIVWSDVNDDGD